MSSDKPARQYTKLINDFKALRLRHTALEAETFLAARRAQETAAATQASADACHNDSVARLAAKHNEERAALVDQLSALRDQLATATLALSTITTERDYALNALSVETSRANHLSTRLYELKPQLDLIADQRAELTQLLDSVRDRLRRKEQRDEAAILNCKVLASATPRRNLG